MSTTQIQPGSDKKLLNAARLLLSETGVADLPLRAVAKRAGVNLGMFHYHFGSKREFTRRLLQDIYEEFFAHLSLESQSEGKPLERLRRSLLLFGRFARQNRLLFTALLSEALRGEKNCGDFFRVNFPRHVRVIADLIARGQRAGEIKPTPLPIAVAFVLGGVGVPNLAVTMMERLKAPTPPKMPSREWKDVLLSDTAIEQRVDLILAGLAQTASRRKRK